VTTVKSSSIVAGEIGGVPTKMIIDSGSTMSLIHQTTLSQLKGTFTKLETPHLHLVTASGDPFPITAHLLLPVVIGETSVLHNFVVIDSLVVPVILGVDFLQTHGVMLDFSTTPVKIDATKTPNVPLIQDASTTALYKAEQTKKDEMISNCSPTRY